MPNEFSKQEVVAYEVMMESFQDALIMLDHVSIYNPGDHAKMERAGDTIWRPQPYILSGYDGSDMTDKYQTATQLSVPASIGYEHGVPWTMTATELRDALQEGSLYESAKQRLSSYINQKLMRVAALQGTLVVKRTSAATGFDDVAQCEAIMNEQGVPFENRTLGLSTRDYNGMAGNLVGTARSFGDKKTNAAYERAYVGQVSGFDTFKLDYSIRQAAAAGGSSITIDTRSTAGNYHVPKATQTASTGERSNVDNRYQTITVSSTTSVAEGDCFTIDGVYAVHQITKESTGQLKTFRVMSVPSSTTLVISPPIISNQGGSDAEGQYQNVSVTASATAAITFLNTAAAYSNPFWQKDALEIVPSRYAVPSDSGLAVLHGATVKGIELTLSKFTDIDTLITKYRADVRLGIINKAPEMSGIILFGQS